METDSRNIEFDKYPRSGEAIGTQLGTLVTKKLKTKMR